LPATHANFTASSKAFKDLIYRTQELNLMSALCITA
jgi:hypothetical protein